MGNTDSQDPCLTHYIFWKKSVVQTFPFCFIFLPFSKKLYLPLDSFCLTSLVTDAIYRVSGIPNKMSGKISNLSRRGKKVFQPSVADQGKHSYDLSPLTMLTQMPFIFPLKLQKIIILLSNEPDYSKTLYIRIKYVLSIQNEQCIIYH